MGGPATVPLRGRERSGRSPSHMIDGLVPFLDTLVEPVVCTDREWRIVYRNPVFAAAWSTDLASPTVRSLDCGLVVMVMRDHGGTTEELLLEAAAIPDSYGRVLAYICRVHQDDTDVLAELRRAAAVISARVSSLDGRSVGSSWSAADDERVGRLSGREREIFDLILNGNRVATVARELFLSEHTVRNYLKRIYAKLDVHSLGELRERMGPSVARPDN